MRIAVTDLKDYNEGVLRFEWLDLEQCSTAGEIGDYIKEFLDHRTKETGELHEEWFVTDYEEFTNLGEYPNLAEIETAVSLSKEYGWEPVARYYEINQQFDDFEEAYEGIHDNEEDFAYDLAHDVYSAKDLGTLELYIDWEKYARDLFIGDYCSAKVEGYKIVVFRLL